MSYLGYGSVTMQSAPCVPVKQERRKKKEGGRGGVVSGAEPFCTLGIEWLCSFDIFF